MAWIKKNNDSSVVNELSNRYELDLLTSSILVRRGITSSEEIKFFMESNIKYLNNPFDFEDIESAIDRILLAIDAQETVLVYGDRDVDGITATVVMVNTLKNFGLKVLYAVPEGDEDYGLRFEDVDKYHKLGVTLIITVDCGISCRNEIAHASDLGIDTIVTDHHNSPDLLPNAFSIMNPKIEDSSYPFELICGCVVASKLSYGLYFTRTGIYNKSITLMNIKPGKVDNYFLEVVKMENLRIVKEKKIDIIPELEGIDFEDYFESDFIVLYDKEQQMKMLKKAFGDNFELECIDIYDQVNKNFPIIEYRSLLKLLYKSKISKYAEKEVSEIDILVQLFISNFYKENSKVFKPYYMDFDLMALGTIADLMPIENENRIIIKNGLKLINKRTRKSLSELLYMQKCYSDVTVKDLAWKITPVINATGRLGVPQKAIELFLEKDENRIHELAKEIISINDQRKKMGQEAWKKIFPKAEESFKKSGEKMVFVHDKTINRGITGIIAIRLSNYFKAPAMIVASINDKIVGSMRSFGDFNSKDFLENFKHNFNDFGGHDFAAGFNLHKDKFKNFAYEVKNYVENMDKVVANEEDIYIDAELPPNYLNLDTINIVDRFAPYGEAFQPLIFSFKSATIQKMEVIGNGEHLRMSIKCGENIWPSLYWNAADLANIEFSTGDKIDFVFSLSRNNFRGDTSLQLEIKDIKKCR